jgi:GT2 family glycosyltransferase
LKDGFKKDNFMIQKLGKEKILSFIQNIYRNIFDAKFYLDRYPDVLMAKVSPLKHFLAYGIKEFRKPRPNYQPLKLFLNYRFIYKYFNLCLVFIRWNQIGDFNSNFIKEKFKFVNIQKYFVLNYLKIKMIIFYVFQKYKLVFIQPNEPKLSIVLVSWNKSYFLLSVLKELIKSEGIDKCEIIIVDNNSGPFTKYVLAKTIGIKVILNDINLGYSFACNQGVAKSKSDYIAFLNTDIFFDAVMIKNLINFISIVKPNSIFGACVLNIDNTIQEVGCRINEDFTTKAIFNNHFQSDIRIYRSGEVDYVSGVFMIVPKKIFVELGGFDTNYSPAYFEDVDLCVRARLAGYHIFVNSLIQIQHFGHGSTGDNSARNLMRINHAKFVSKFKKSETRVRSNYEGPNKKILIIDSLLPIEIIGRGAPRQKEILKKIVLLGHEVTFLFQEKHENLEKTDLIDFIPQEGGVEFTGPLNHELLLQFLETEVKKYDVVWVSRLENLKWLLCYFNEFFELQGMKKIFDFESFKESEYKIIQKLLKENLSDNFNLNALFNNIFAVSPIVKKELSAHNVESMILGHEIRKSNRSFKSSMNVRRIIILGNFSKIESPNVKGLTWFCKEVVPLIEIQKTKINIDIIGQVENRVKKYINQPGINLLGVIQDLNQISFDSAIGIVPVFEINGLPHKVHTLVGLGLPLIVTEQIALSLGWKNEKECLIASSPNEMANAVIKLHKDPSLQEEIYFNSRRSLENLFDETEFNDSLKDILG